MSDCTICNNKVVSQYVVMSYFPQFGRIPDIIDEIEAPRLGNLREEVPDSGRRQTSRSSRSGAGRLPLLFWHVITTLKEVGFLEGARGS